VLAFREGMIIYEMSLLFITIKMRKLFSLAITFMMTCALASCGIPSKETGETIQTVKI
jgi:hypothetical protein